MFFGEKYGQRVRVVNVGAEFGAGLSTELCGGTHVRRTGDIGQCRIVAESSVGSGIRRLEALTGTAALELAHEHQQRLRAVATALRAPLGEVVERLESLQARLRETERALAAAQQQSAADEAQSLVTHAVAVAGLAVVAAAVEASDAEQLKTLADDVCARLGTGGVALLGAVLGDKALVVCKASDEAVARGAHAGNAVKAAAEAIGGRGGGRPQFAQAGGGDATRMKEAIAAGLAALRGQLGG
jgi:alanyl-tRNA synthetase